ncbi:MAG: ABC transporter permease [Gemmatimonadales bacterium]|nr:ABC transporter permease [Gemmatimonadales bacterium]
MDTIFQDLKYAFRSLKQAPGLFLVASLSLAIGVAVNVTLFAGVDILLLRPLDYPNTERLLAVWSDNKARGWDQNSVAMADFVDWRTEAKSVTLAAATGGSFNLADTDQPERVTGLRISPNLFSMLGVAPALGRTFQMEEERPGEGRTAIITDGFWQSHFASDPGTVGKTIRLDGEPVTIVGIMPKGFKFGSNQNAIFTPLTVPAVPDRGNRYLQVYGLLAPNGELEQVNNELTGITGRLAGLYPATNEGMGAHALTLQDQIVGPTPRQAGLICMVAVTFVLLIACANVANLLLSRAAGRNRELAVRSALGAQRTRLVRQLLTESMILAMAGGALGLLLSVAGVQWFASIIPPDFSNVEQLGINGRVLAYGMMLIVGAGIVAGIAPAFQVTRGSLTDPLKDGGRSGSMGLRHGRLRSSLVVAEIALALVLLISAGLLVKSSLQLQRTDLGFEPKNALTFAVSLSAKEYPDTAQVLTIQDGLRERFAALPGVKEVGAVTQLPMSGGSGSYYHVEGEPVPEVGKRPVLQYRNATAGYLDAIGIRMLKGRDFGPEDRLGSAKVVLINETLGKRHWPKGDALGHRLVFDWGTFEIVGMVADVREFGPDDPAPALLYFAAPQSVARNLRFVVRTTGDPNSLVPAIRLEVAKVARDLPAYSVRSLQEHVDLQMQGDMIMPKLLALLGGIALTLAVIGVYGVMAYSVSQRTQELGIRRALGAGGRDILRLVLRQGVTLSGLGALIGVGLALAATKALSAFLFGVSAFDPVVFSGVTFSLVGAAIIATLVPARRATRVDPLVALKND